MKCTEFENLMWEAAEAGKISDELRDHADRCENCRKTMETVLSAVDGLTILKSVPPGIYRREISLPERKYTSLRLLPAFAAAAVLICLITIASLLLFRKNRIETMPFQPVITQTDETEAIEPAPAPKKTEKAAAEKPRPVPPRKKTVLKPKSKPTEDPKTAEPVFEKPPVRLVTVIVERQELVPGLEPGQEKRITVFTEAHVLTACDPKTEAFQPEEYCSRTF